MLSVNKQPLALTTFPDGTSSFRYDTRSQRGNFLVEWNYDSDHECIALWYLVNHIREHEPMAKIVLDMPYLPNGRMDRVKNADEVFTIKWFVKFINGMCFESVYIRDPHSIVGAALINRVKCFDVTDFVNKVVAETRRTGVSQILCYPDEGALKKYSEQIKGEYVFGIKHRDWRTGKIESLQLNNPDAVKGKDVLIVDDICSRGGTFIFTAKALKDAGAENIVLYVTHCENTILKGDIPNSDLISHVYTTSSIYRGQHEKITVLQ